MTNTINEKVIIFKTKKHYWCKCEKCGWEDASENAIGGGQIADTGDYDEVYCPICGSTDLDGDSKHVIDESYEDQVVEIPLREYLRPFLARINVLTEMNWNLSEQVRLITKNKVGNFE